MYETEFEFDSEVVASRVYRTAMRSIAKSFVISSRVQGQMPNQSQHNHPRRSATDDASLLSGLEVSKTNGLTGPEARHDTQMLGARDCDRSFRDMTSSRNLKHIELKRILILV